MRGLRTSRPGDRSFTSEVDLVSPEGRGPKPTARRTLPEPHERKGLTDCRGPFYGTGRSILNLFSEETTVRPPTLPERGGGREGTPLRRLKNTGGPEPLSGQLPNATRLSLALGFHVRRLGPPVQDGRVVVLTSGPVIPTRPGPMYLRGPGPKFRW